MIGFAELLGERLRPRRAEIDEAITACIRRVAVYPVEREDAVYREGQRQTVVALLDYALLGIEGGEDLAGPIPLEAMVQVRRAARAGIGLDAIVRRYIAGNTLLWDFVFEEAYHGDLLGNAAELRYVHAMLASLFDRVFVAIHDEYVHEIERLAQSHEQRRAECARRLLAGEPVDYRELDYEVVAAWHVGVIGRGVGAARAIRALQARLGCDSLHVTPDDENVWAWLGGRRKPNVDDVERMLPTTLSADVSLAVGEPAQGLEGWCTTHRQAQEALLVSLRAPKALTRYADVALSASWLQDATKAQWLMDAYLSPLDDCGRSSPSLRPTLRAYFAAGRNASVAARTLRVSRRTMRNRMLIIERALGNRLNENQAELELALRLHELHGEDP